MSETITNQIWILAQLARVRTLEAEVRGILATEKTPGIALVRRVAELKFQLNLLDIGLN
jgi:hypothetical protein